MKTNDNNPAAKGERRLIKEAYKDIIELSDKITSLLNDKPTSAAVVHGALLNVLAAYFTTYKEHYKRDLRAVQASLDDDVALVLIY